MRESAVADLARSGIAPADAEAAGMFDVADASTIYPPLPDGHTDYRQEPALVIPYFNPDGTMVQFERAGKVMPFCRVRWLETPKRAAGFVHKRDQKYSQPQKSGVRAYFPPGIDWPRIIADAAEPVVITEGEKKALCGVLQGFPVIALGGVFNFMDTPDALLQELDAVTWRGRDVYVCFDSDAALNSNILAAEARLVDELQRKRGARCYLVRLPQDGEKKVGLDDFIVAHGGQGFVGMLQSAEKLDALDAKIVSLNKSVAWIEQENLVYDLEQKLFIPKTSFISGSRFSALKHITTGGKNRTPKEVSISNEWLTHPHAQRFSQVLFRPGEGPTVTGDHGRPALNLWTGWDTLPGPVTEFLKLTEFLFKEMPEDQRWLPLQLMIYKAQHPAEKIPLALVLIGEQGSGKSLWADCMADAFAPYSAVISSKSFHSEFQNWLEKSLLGVIHEAEHEDMLRGKAILKSLISDLQRPMNEKYRPIRQINSYTQYILTSNSRAVGAFDPDDRRMIVCACPKPLAPTARQEFYGPIFAWKANGGGKMLLDWMLNFDLQGWTPPKMAPMSAEKYMAYVESLTPVQRLAEEMRTSDYNTVKLWLDSAVEWARMAEMSANPTMVSMAKATLDNVPRYQIRPFYTPEELALMFPVISSTLMGSKIAKSTPAGAISRELRDAGVPYLQCKDDPRGFRWRGMLRQFLVVSEPEDWRAPLSQAEFDRLMGQFPSYGAIVARGRAA